MTLSPQQWVELKPSTRQALVKIFRIPQSSFTHVADNKLVSTGHTYEDLKAISMEEMKLLTHSSSESFEEQFKIILNMVESEGAPIENAINNGLELKGVSGSEGKDQGAVSPGSGDEKKESISQGEILPVSGGSEQIDRGRAESLPSDSNIDKASVAEQNAEVDTQEFRPRKNAGRPKSGLQKV